MLATTTNNAHIGYLSPLSQFLVDHQVDNPYDNTNNNNEQQYQQQSNDNNNENGILHFFINNNNNQSSSFISSSLITCQCEGGFDLNDASTTSKTSARPRGAPFSIYVNDKLHVTLSNHFLSQYITHQTSSSSSTTELFSLCLRTFLFEDENLDESLEEYVLPVNFQPNSNNISSSSSTTTVIVHIRRDNTSRRRNRKQQAKTIKGTETEEDVERKKKMRRSLNQEATKKVCFLQLIRKADGMVLANSQNLWCKSKTRSEMDKKRERRMNSKQQETTTTKRTKNSSTKRKSASPSSSSSSISNNSSLVMNNDMEVLVVDENMIQAHLGVKRAKTNRNLTETSTMTATATTQIPVNNTSSDEEIIPEEMMQMIPSDWTTLMTKTNGTCYNNFQTPSTMEQMFCTLPKGNNYSNSATNVVVMEDNNCCQDDSFMFQEECPSPFLTSPFNLDAGVNLDDMNWGDLFETTTSSQPTTSTLQMSDLSTPTQIPTLSKAVCLDEYDDFESILNEMGII